MSDQPPDKPAESNVEPQQLFKMLLELGPLVVFFVVNWQAGKFIDDPSRAIFWGTGSFMVATVIALTVSRSLYGRVPLMPLISGVLVLVFGGATLAMQDELFIKMKPTIVNLLFAGVLFGGLAFGQSLLKYLFGEVFRLTEAGWKTLTFRWACFFLVLALINEVVWRSFSTEFWIGFKIWGIIPITMIFAIAQLGVLKRHEISRES